MKLFNKLSQRTKAILVTMALSVLIVFCVHVEIEYAAAAQGMPVFQVSGGVGEGSLVNAAGRVGLTAHDYLNEVREGNIADHSFVRIQGNNVALGSTLAEMSILSTAFPGNWPSSAAVVLLLSDSALDSTGSTGALTVQLSGLDSTFTPLVEIVTMQGLNSAYTLDSFYRLNDIEVVTAGSGLTNAGLITASIGGADIIALQDGHSKTTEGRYTVPADNMLYLEGAEGSAVGTSKNATFHLFTRNTQVANSPFVLQQLWQTQNGGYIPDGKLAGIPEKTDVIIIGQGTAAANVAAASYQGWIEE